MRPAARLVVRHTRSVESGATAGFSRSAEHPVGQAGRGTPQFIGLLAGLVAVAAGMLGMLLGPSSAAAQPPVRRSWSPSPTLSPWLDLFRADLGVLDPYNSLVRPRLEFQEQLRRQQLDLARQAAGLSAVRQQMIQSSRPMPIRPTGAASVFMDYSHYYPGFQGSAHAGTPRAGGRHSWSPPSGSAQRNY